MHFSLPVPPTHDDYLILELSDQLDETFYIRKNPDICMERKNLCHSQRTHSYIIDMIADCDGSRFNGSRSTCLLWTLQPPVSRYLTSYMHDMAVTNDAVTEMSNPSPLNTETEASAGFQLKFCTVCASNQNRYV